ncbi:hypothetical protein JKP88DRAFT_281658 [Tribonema minus]|uniref:Uncharacterized protein n=1 Tax=Tribonema minus TaxID=303371 RepID=A0A835YVF5_9STRA|nr:hypothetical protein JKP88DRAFT_281658 [Tribonema minus]
MTDLQRGQVVVCPLPTSPLKALRLAKLLVDMGVRMRAAELSKHQRGAVIGLDAQQSASAPASSSPGGGAPRPPPNSKLGLVFASYAPVVEGLPSFDPKEVQEAIEEGGCITAPQAAQLSHFNVVASALTELCKPSVAYADGLVSAACYGGKDLLLVVMGINQRLGQVSDARGNGGGVVMDVLRPVVVGFNHRIGQVMHMINSGGAAQPAVRVAGARLRVMVDRVVRALRGGLLRRSGFNQVKLVSDAAFLHLLDGDEEGCLQLLLELLRMCHAAPGLMRFIPWRHNQHRAAAAATLTEAKLVSYHWAAALLLSAGLCKRYIEFARLYNALCMGGGLDQLPLDEAGKAALCRCKYVPAAATGKAALCRCKNDRCAAAHRVVAERAASGAAHVFLNYTLLSSATAAVMPAAAHAPISVVSCPMGVCAPPAAVMDEYTVEAAAAAAPGLAAAAAAPPIVPQLPRQTQARERHAAFAAAGPASGAVAPMAQSAANVVHRSPPSGLTHFGGSASSTGSQGSGYSSGGSGGGGAAIPVTWNTNLSAQAASGRSAAAAAAAAAAGADFVSADSDYAAARNVWSAASLSRSAVPGLRGEDSFGGGGGGAAAGSAPVGSGTVGDAAAARIHADWSAAVMHLPHGAPAPYVFSGGSAGSGASARSDEEELMAALAAELEADELNDLLQLSGGVAAPLPPELQWQQAWQQQQQQRVPEEPLHYEQQLLGASSFAGAQAAPFHQQPQPQPQHNAALAALAAASPALSDMDLATVLLSDNWLADECL